MSFGGTWLRRGWLLSAVLLLSACVTVPVPVPVAPIAPDGDAGREPVGAWARVLERFVDAQGDRKSVV